MTPVTPIRSRTWTHAMGMDKGPVSEAVQALGIGCGSVVLLVVERGVSWRTL